jgi:hypothetical protein
MDNVKILLTNKTGGYCLMAETPATRFEGLFFRRDGRMIKTAESLRFSAVADKVTNHLWCVERRRGHVTEKILMPEGKDALLIDMSAPLEMTIVLDCKESYDNRVWGRNYDVSAEKGCVVFSFAKRNDAREDNNGLSEFECHLAVCAQPLDYIPLKTWEEHHYTLDNSRQSPPDSRWTYAGAKLRGSRFALGFGTTKKEAVATARDVLAHASRIMTDEERRVAALTTRGPFKNAEAEVSRKCCIHGLDALTVDDGVYAGLPWFFQFWARDELISSKALLRFRPQLAKQIMFRHLKTLKDGRLVTNPDAKLLAADAPGWLFFRLEDLCRYDDEQNEKILTKSERNLIAEKLSEYLDNVQRFRLKDGLVQNGPQETWMDTVWAEDDRAGSRIEIQALTLANCRLHTTLTGKTHNLEKGLRELTRKTFAKKTLCDGAGDPTARPNIFIAAYVYPELFSKKEWSAFVNTITTKLWLPWGGLSTIDVKNPLFTPRYTGENNKSYHRGDSWFWINNIAAIVMLRIDKKKFERQINKILHASTHELTQMGASGFSAEVSSAEQLRSEGCIAQAWSMATLLELLEERFG